MSLTNDDKKWIVGAITDALEEVVLPRFDALEARMDRLEMRMDRLEARMDALEGRVSNLESDMSHVKRSLASLEDRVETLENDVHAIYLMIHKEKHPTLTDKKFAKLPMKQRVAILEQEVSKLSKELHTAKQ